MNTDELVKSAVKDVIFRVIPNFPKEGVNFVDFTPSTLNVVSMSRIGLRLTALISEKYDIKDIDAIVCPDARGFIWGTLMACLLGRPMIPVRKHGKLPPESICDSETYGTEYSKDTIDLPKVEDLQGRKFLFIDDVYATGGTYKACKAMVERHGGTVLGAYVIYNVGLTDDTDVHSILTSEDIK